VLADLRTDCERTEDDKLTISLRYDGQLPTFITCINRHNLHCILKAISPKRLESNFPQPLVKLFLNLRDLIYNFTHSSPELFNFVTPQPSEDDITVCTVAQCSVKDDFSSKCKP